MKFFFAITAIAAALANPVLAHDAKKQGKKATAEQNKIMAMETAKFIKALNERGIRAGNLFLTVETLGVDLNPEKCCTVITPDDITTECPCGS